MKIGLINFHYAYNHGAVLQCLALKKKLEEMGNKVVVINYRPAYQMQYYLPYPNPAVCALWAYRRFRHQGLKKQLYHMAGRAFRVLSAYREAGRRKEIGAAFRPFVEKHLNMTQAYKNFAQLVKSPPACDAYICGSDQIWNPVVTWGLDPAYFVSFGGPEVRRIAYAISPCAQLDVKEYAEELQAFTAKLDAISLREAEKKADLEALLNRPISVCPDPTLFFSAEGYAEFEEPCMESEPYILVYAFRDEQQEPLFQEALSFLSRKESVPIIDISLDELSWPVAVKRNPAISPGQFLSYIKNAKYVITNSFHASVFSILYRTPFGVIAKEATNGRLQDLLGYFQKESCYITKETIHQIELDQNMSLALLQEKRQKRADIGIEYLSECLK